MTKAVRKRESLYHYVKCVCSQLFCLDSVRFKNCNQLCIACDTFAVHACNSHPGSMTRTLLLVVCLSSVAIGKRRVAPQFPIALYIYVCAEASFVTFVLHTPSKRATSCIGDAKLRI